jgi:RHS repeat-associated protein
VTSDGTSQSRTSNVQNQITSISGASTPGYDANGNTLADETGKQFVYDAWNRLVRVKDGGGNTLETFLYDALNRRVVVANGVGQDLYYSSAWQVVEERSSGVTQVQYDWSPLYLDGLVDRNAAGGTRLYVQQDADWNVTSVADRAGVVQERYIYDPYGLARYTAADWTPESSSTVGWVYLHQGGRYDGVSGLYNFRFRDESPTLGRWMEQDPLGYTQTPLNLYLYEKDAPTDRLDPFGEKDVPIAPPAKTPDKANPGKGCNPNCKTYKPFNLVSFPKAVPGEEDGYEDTVRERLKKHTAGFEYTMLEVTGVADFQKQTEKLPMGCSCVQFLYIFGHGNSDDTGFWQRIGSIKNEWKWGESHLASNNGDLYGASLFDNIPFCKPCTIRLLGCSVGKSATAQTDLGKLAKDTGCTVIANKIDPDTDDTGFQPTALNDLFIARP